MSGTCSTYGGEESCSWDFGGKAWGRERERSLGELSVDMRIILKSMLKEWDGDTDWIFTAQDRDRWQVNVVLNLRVLWNAGNLLTGCGTVIFSKRKYKYVLHGVCEWLGGWWRFDKAQFHHVQGKVAFFDCCLQSVGPPKCRWPFASWNDVALLKIHIFS